MTLLSRTTVGVQAGHQRRAEVVGFGLPDVPRVMDGRGVSGHHARNRDAGDREGGTCRGGAFAQGLHEIDDLPDDPGGSTAARRNGEGSLYQRHDQVSCPKVGPDDERPEHRCRGRWVGAVTLDSGKRAVFYGATKADVKGSIKQAQARMAVGAPAKDAKTPLSVVVTGWIASPLEASDRKPSTKVTYATLLRSQVLTDEIASKPLADLKPSHIEQFTVRMRVKGCSPSTVRQTYTVLRSVLETAVRDELLATNPAARVKRPGVPRTEAHYLSIAEVAALLEAAKDSRHVPLFRLLVSTGLRRGEALALRWQDVDLTNGVLRVRGTLSRVTGHLGHQ